MNLTELGIQLTRYEAGELDEQETLELFDRLVATGLAWELQGHYGRMAVQLLDAELLPLGELA